MRKILLTVMTLASIFTMEKVSAQYCVPTYATGCGSGDEIDDFEIPTGGLSHLGSGCSTAAYGDFTGDATLEADLQISETYAFSATHNFGSQYVSIWIDFDNSGTFDPGELLFTSSTGGNTTSGSITIPVSATTTTTVMRVVDNYNSPPNDPCNPGSSWGETHDYTVNILPPPTCPTPTNLAASNITTTDVDLNWTNGGSETAWNIEYGPVGFTPGTGTVVAAGSNPFTLTGLTPSTDYDIYVQADCGGGDLSNFSTPVTISTNCVPFTATYTQDFDAVTTPDLPNCWSGILNSTSTAAYLETSTLTTPNSTPNHVRMYNSATAGATTDLMLISPQFSDLPNATNQIRFYAKTGANQEDLIVGTMSDPTDPATFTPYSTITTLTNTYEEYTISFGAYTGSDEYIAFRHANTATTRYIYIDDFVYEPLPSCPSPFDMSILNTSSSSIELGWTNGASETAWNIEYGPVGFTQGTGTVVAANSNPFTVTGLNDGETYEFYIQADCGPGDQSTWFGPITGSTNCLAFTAPFTEDFESANWVSGTGGSNINDQIDNCWSRNPATSASFFWGTRTGTTSSTTTGPSGDNTTGSGQYVFTEGSNGATGDWATITSPVIDISGLSNPIVEYYYHFYGANIDTFFVDAYDGSAWNPVDTIVGQVQTANSDDWEYRFVNVSAVALGITDFQFRFRAKRGTSFNADYAIDDVAVIEEPTCLPPSNLVASNPTSNSIDLNWTNGGTETAWNIEYGPAGFTQGTGTVVAANSNPFTVTGLNDATTYEFYVQADCGAGDESSWVGVTSGTTTLAPLSCGTGAPFPIYETDFENEVPSSFTQSATSNPQWTFENGGGTTSTNTGPSGAFSGNGYIYLETTGGTQGDTDTLTSPNYDLTTAQGNARLVFFYHMYGADMGVLSVDVSNDGGATWNNEFSVSGEIQTAETDDWIPANIDLSSYIGSNIQFRIIGERGNGYEGDMAIDSLTLEACVTCPGPSNLNVTNITANDADFSWDAGGSETMWNIEWGPTGFIPGTGAEDGSIIGTTNMMETISGLNPATDYDIYVQADCGGGDESMWVGPYTFTTECAAFTVPYLESFSSGAQPNCWETFSFDGNTAVNANWKFTGNPGYSASSANNGKPAGTFAWVDGSTPDDSQAILESNWIDLTGLTVPMLSFELFSNNTNNPGDNMTFLVQLDDGNTTTTIYTFTGDSSEWVLHQVDLSAYAGQTVRFNFIVDQTTAATAYYNDILLDEVAVCETEDAGFTYNDSVMCIQSNSEMPIISGVTGGTFEGTAGLDIDVNTGEINPSNTTPGVYEVTYTSSADPCRSSETITIEVISFEDASFDYAETELCPLDSSLAANVTGLTGGTFSSAGGLDLDSNTGEIDPYTSTPGQYTVTYTSSNSGCASSETFDIEIIEGEDASFSYGENTFCINEDDITVDVTGETGGTFSSDSALSLDTLSGQISPQASTPGTYWVSYTTTGNTGCVGVDSIEITIDECLGLGENAMNSISVYPNPANDVVNYVLPEMTGSVDVTMMDATGKVVYENQVNGNAGSEEINVGKFENGMYLITFKNNDQITTKRIVISR